MFPLRKRKVAPIVMESSSSSRYEYHKVMSYREGANEMRDAIAQHLTWHAEDAENEEARAHTWAAIMHIRQMTPQRYENWPY